jgi:glycosyltransferase involved in cell wall biosynthesis
MFDVLYAHQDGGITGSAISLRNLLVALDREKYSPRVALFSDGPARGLYEAINIPVDVVKAHPFWTFPGCAWTELGFYYNLLALLPNKNWMDYLNKRKPMLLHVNDKSCLQAGIAARKMDVPIVWHLRSSYAPSRSRLHAKISSQMIRKNANAVIAISDDEVDGFEGCTNLRVIHNSLDFDVVDAAMPRRDSIRDELKIGADEVVIGLVASQLNWVRGAWDFLDIAGRVQKKTRASLKFVIVSPATNDSLLQAKALAKQYDIEDRLTLTGFRSDVLAVIAALDILVVCNHHGVMGRPPFEAMAVGTPVAAWQGHSLRSDVVRNGETALLASRGDLESLAQAVVRLADDAVLRKSLSERGMQYARENFDPQCNARLVEQVYEDVLGVTQ